MTGKLQYGVSMVWFSKFLALMTIILGNKMKTLITALAIILLSATAWAETNVTLTWDPNTEPDLAGYNVYMSGVSGQPGTQVMSVTTPTATLLDLPDGPAYFVVTAFDTEGMESGYSNQVGKVLNAPPGVPQGFTITITITVTQQ